MQLLIVCFTLAISGVVSGGRVGKFVPRLPYTGYDAPKIEAYSPNGLRVSIPHVDGMSRFTFHGNVNAKIPVLSSGQITHTVDKPQNGRWSFEDLETKLRVGDAVHYWFYVQVDGEDHTLFGEPIIIRDVLPKKEIVDDLITDIFKTNAVFLKNDTTIMTSTTPPAVSTGGSLCSNSEQYKTLQSLMEVTLMQINSLHEKLSPLEAQVRSLTELLLELVKDMNIGTKLLLTGLQPPTTNPAEAIRTLITEKLGLLDLERNILQAFNTDAGVLFEMSSSVDKKRILHRAATKLQNAKYQIVDPQKHWPEATKVENEEITSTTDAANTERSVTG